MHKAQTAATKERARVESYGLRGCMLVMCVTLSLQITHGDTEYRLLEAWEKAERQGMTVEMVTGPLPIGIRKEAEAR